MALNKPFEEKSCLYKYKKHSIIIRPQHNKQYYWAVGVMNPLEFRSFVVLFIFK